MMTFAEILSSLGLLGLIIVAWVKMNIKIAEVSKSATLEMQSLKETNTISHIALKESLDLQNKATKAELIVEIKAVEQANIIRIEALRKEVQLHIESIKSSTKGLTDFLGVRLIEFVNDNKGDHEEIKKNMEKLFDTINNFIINESKKNKN